MSIYFHSEDVDFRCENKLKVKKWIKQVIGQSERSAKNINIIFCSDNFIQGINNQYLKHNFSTDVITFDHSEENTDEIEADLYVGVETVRENAEAYKDSFQKELYRVIIHGILHLIGYNDKSKDEKKAMRHKEDECLKLIV